ncbi:MAG: hypothetical protein H6963_14045 [Chromatiaceae bacterium]|nr:hypothetical protein [Chromatiaceae bacterium]
MARFSILLVRPLIRTDDRQFERKGMVILVDFEIDSFSMTEVKAVPIPAAVWLFSFGLLGLFGVVREKTAQ